MGFVLSPYQKEFVLERLEKWSHAKTSYSIYGTGKVAAGLLSFVIENNLQMPTIIMDHMDQVKELAGIPVTNLEQVNVEDFGEIIMATLTWEIQRRMGRKIRERFGVTITPTALPMAEQAYNMGDKGEDLWKSDLFDYRDEELLVSRIYCLSKTSGYALYGANAFSAKLVSLLKTHSVALPEFILVEDKAPKVFEGIVTKTWDDLDGQKPFPVILATKYRVDEFQTRLGETVTRHPISVIDIFSASHLDYNIFESIHVPYVVNKSFLLEMASSCNLECRYCRNHGDYKFHPTPGLEVDLEKTLSLLPKLKGHIRVFMPVGGGEILLNSDLETIISAAKKHIPYVSVLTNATLLTRKRADKLAESGLDKLFFSIDSLDEAYAKKIRGIHLEKIIDNVSYFSKTYSIPVGISAVVGPENVFDAHRIFELKKSRIPTLESISYVRWRDESEFGMRDIPFGDINSFRLKATELSREYGVTMNMDNGGFEITPHKRCVMGPICRYLWSQEQIVAFTTGRARVCCYGGPWIHGNIFEDPLMDMLNAPEMLSIRRNALKGVYPDYPFRCRSYCKYPAEGVHEGGDDA